MCIRVYACVCVAGLHRVPPTTWALYVLHLLFLPSSALSLPLCHFSVSPINPPNRVIQMVKTLNYAVCFEIFFGTLGLYSRLRVGKGKIVLEVQCNLLPTATPRVSKRCG